MRLQGTRNRGGLLLLLAILLVVAVLAIYVLTQTQF
jgi:hypothetical protein